MPKKIRIDWSNRSHFYNKDEIKYLTNFIKYSKNLTQGNELKKFEKILENYLGIKNIFAVTSAASALELIALLLDLKYNDEVIIPAHTYCASAIPFARQRAKIVWADIDPNTRVIDFDDVKKKITKKTKAIVLVHLYGYAIDVDKFKKLKTKKIKIIEDCAQALGAEVNKKKVGTIGDFSCFSFHAQKNITTLGEGGAIYVKEKKLAKKIKGLRHNGHRPYLKQGQKYWLPAMTNVEMDLKNSWPYKFTLSEIQCAAGYVAMKRINALNNKRISRAKYFINQLKNYDVLKFNSNFKNNRHVYHLITAEVKKVGKFDRNYLIKKLYEKYGIKCVIQFFPLYNYGLFKKMKKRGKKCNNSEKFYRNMISFPFHVWMKEKDFKYMISSIKKVLEEFIS